ncbi:hypothetical protein TRVL_07487 [Trypanosoma vivax]|nr:hypothetical protein TRVL_07487 [Trypanosoma vivax]
MVKRLNVMNDTFTALEAIAHRVMAVETCMSKFVGRLSERAKALGMNHLTVDGMKHAREAVVATEANVSSALKNITPPAKDDAKNGLRALLGHENGLSHRLPRSKSGAEMERGVLLQLVNEVLMKLAERQNELEGRKAVETTAAESDETPPTQKATVSEVEVVFVSGAKVDNKDLNDLEDAMMGVDADGHDAVGVGSVRSQTSKTTVASAITLPIVFAASAAAAWMLFSRRRQSPKEVANL